MSTEPSLNKAYKFIANDGFGRVFHKSWRNFIDHWNYFKNASIFLYLNEYNFKRSFLLNPLKHNFALEVDRLSNDPADIFELFGMAKTLSPRLMQKLHSKSRNKMEIPIIPNSVASVILQSIDLGDEVRRAVYNYDLNSTNEIEMFPDSEAGFGSLRSLKWGNPPVFNGVRS